mmetsp:Transcript_76412/g.88840  ORF Transcript_76412/g.88840 Transcript_76412/m.88840 type:complete len:513 (+) Transcript_76412:104-1642(+)
MESTSKASLKKSNSGDKSPENQGNNSLTHESRQDIDPQEQEILPRGSRPEIDGDIHKQYDKLEANLSHVSTQQDALLPLMNLLELAPSVQKSVGLMKLLGKRQEETDIKLAKFEESLRLSQKHTDLQIQKANDRQPIDVPDSASFEKSLKSVFNRVAEQQYQYKDLENKLSNLDKSVDDRLKVDLDSLSKTVESKLDKHRQETINDLKDLKNGTNQNLKKFDDVLKDIMGKSEKFADFMQYNERQKILEDINSLITMKNQQHFEFFRDKYDKDIENLYREFGILRSEMDLYYDEKRHTKVSQLLEKLPDDLIPAEKRLKVNNIDQTINIQELDKFNRNNTQRIMYELLALDEKIDDVQNEMNKLNYQIHKPPVVKENKDKKGQLTEEEKYEDEDSQEDEFKDQKTLLKQYYHNMKYQIEGARKKSLFDMKRIEEKMEKIQKIKAEAEDELVKNPKLKKKGVIPAEVQVIDDFPKKIKYLMDEIDKNLDTSTTRLEIIQERMKDDLGITKIIQ